MRRFRALVLVACIAGVVGGLPPGATGKVAAFSGMSRGVSAYAGWEECTEEFCSSFVDLYVFQGTEKDAGKPFRGTTVCIFSFSERTDGFESGCTTAPSGTLSVGNRLSSAVLRPTQVSVIPCTYDPKTDEEICFEDRARTVTVSARWTARGGLSRSGSRYSFRDETCTETYWAKGTGRFAEATGVVDGTSLGTSDYGEIHKGMTRFRSTCPYFEH